jgi:hypothetical protein
MLKNWTRDIRLAIQARTGASPALFVWATVMVLASVTAFIFLCVCLYDWLSLEFGGVVAGLMTAGTFIVIAAICAIICALARRRARERAILARAARAQAPSSWLLDPKLLGTALQVGRRFGWQRIVPIALLGFMAAQWAREHREHGQDGAG